MEEQIEVKKYSVFQSVFALVSIVLGFLFVKFILAVMPGISSTIYYWLIGAFAIWYLIKNGVKISFLSFSGFMVLMIFALSFSLFNNPVIMILNNLFLIITLLYWLFAVSNNREDGYIGDMLINDIVKSIIIMPFTGFLELFKSIKFNVKVNKYGKTILMIFLGLFFVFPVVVVVFFLLRSADVMFGYYTNKLIEIFQIDNFDIITTIGQIILGFPIACYIYGAVYNNAIHAQKEVLKKASFEKEIKNLRMVSKVVLLSYSLPLLLIYLLFFLTQISYFFGAFSNIKPENFSYAEYARSGFFQLCVVAVINSIVIILVEILSKRKDNLKSKTQKAVVIIFSLFTIMLISTAISKMIMYIRVYGLTQLRVYTSWFMVLLAVFFILLIIKQFTQKLNFFKSLFAAFVIMFGILVFSNSDALIAKYNVTMYLNGSHKTIDIDAMKTLSYAAVEPMIPLLSDSDKNVREKTNEMFKSIYLDISNYQGNLGDLRELNLTKYRVYKILDGYYCDELF